MHGLAAKFAKKIKTKFARLCENYIFQSYNNVKLKVSKLSVWYLNSACFFLVWCRKWFMGRWGHENVLREY